ncbi:MAG: hypothetical protein KGI46_02625 [Alphaproteobacteria bacterium]|nr:hypothetical protein [Alphaproteobacteria bacterium]
MSDRDNAAKSRGSDGGLRSPSRRLILGGIPVAVTLASKPALAMTGECSVSNALSGNLSHPLPEGTNCGLTPESWIKLAGTEQLWTRTGFAPSTSFLSACGSQSFGSQWSCGDQSLLAALEGGLTVTCKVGKDSVTLNARNFGAQLAAAILNAGCFSPTNYPETVSQVRALAAAVWSSQPATQSLAQSQLDAATGRVSNLNINS